MKTFLKMSIVEKLIYCALVALFFVSSVSTLTTAKFMTRINGGVVATNANVIVELVADEENIVFDSSWAPGVSQNYEFTVRNYDDDGNVSQTSCYAMIIIEVADLLPLNFTLSYDCPEEHFSNISVDLTDGQRGENTFRVLKTAEESIMLPHTTAKTYNFTLNVTWDNEAQAREFTELGGDYLRIKVDWKQLYVDFA